MKGGVTAVAVKFLNDGTHMDLKSFRQEASVLAACRDPHICQFLGASFKKVSHPLPSFLPGKLCPCCVLKWCCNQFERAQAWLIKDWSCRAQPWLSRNTAQRVTSDPSFQAWNMAQSINGWTLDRSSCLMWQLACLIFMLGGSFILIWKARIAWSSMATKLKSLVRLRNILSFKIGEAYTALSPLAKGMPFDWLETIQGQSITVFVGCYSLESLNKHHIKIKQVPCLCDAPQGKSVRLAPRIQAP